MNAIDVSWVTTYTKTVQTHATLSREEELELFLRWRADGDERARDRLVRASQRHVIALARKHLRYGVSLAELVAEGNFGVVRALEKFDPARGTLFMTYASHWIRACILQHVLKTWSIVGSGLPRSKLFFKLRRERMRLHNALGERENVDQALAERLGVSAKALHAMIERLDQRDFSLEVEIFAEGHTTFGATLPSSEPNQEERALSGEFNVNAEEAVREALAELDPRERYIVEHRLLADRHAEVSLADVGRLLGVSRERARQLEARAKRKLRACIASRPGAKDWLDLPSAA